LLEHILVKNNMNNSNPIPTILEAPQTASDAAIFIWEQQDRLNAFSHPAGKGTLSPFSPEEREVLIRDYRLALISEVAELMDNCYWKHWSTEAKAGRRFELLNAKATSGEGSAQNVVVEIIDILFFTVSLIQLLDGSLREPGTESFKSDWVLLWTMGWDAASIKAAKISAKQGSLSPADMSEILNRAVALLGAACGSRIDLVPDLIALMAAAGLTWSEVARLYSIKLVKNYERQLRGRKQVGDNLAEQENSEVR
jgi:hypothetical protein